MEGPKEVPDVVVCTATSDSDGVFDLGEVDPGMYELVIAKEGYVTVNVSVSISEAVAAGGGGVADVALAPAGVLAGASTRPLLGSTRAVFVTEPTQYIPKKCLR